MTNAARSRRDADRVRPVVGTPTMSGSPHTFTAPDGMRWSAAIVAPRAWPATSAAHVIFVSYGGEHRLLPYAPAKWETLTEHELVELLKQTADLFGAVSGSGRMRPAASSEEPRARAAIDSDAAVGHEPLDGSVDTPERLPAPGITGVPEQDRVVAADASSPTLSRRVASTTEISSDEPAGLLDALTSEDVLDVALADAASAGPSRRVKEAAFAVARLVAEWAALGGRPLRGGPSAIYRAGQAVDGLVVGPVRTTLEAVVALLGGDAGQANLAMLVHASGEALEHAGAYGVAARLYGLAVHVSECDTQRGRAVGRDARPRAYDRLGFCLRQLGQLDGAGEAYARGREAARESHDCTADLRIRISMANLVALRGDAPRAERALAEVMRDALRANAPNERALAAHDRGVLTLERGAATHAIRYFSVALNAYAEERLQQRVLADLAQAFAALGAIEVARDAHLILVARAVEHDAKCAALVNLMRLAAQENDLHGFEMYRRAVAASALPKRLATIAAIEMGDGYVRFGRPEPADKAYRRAVRTARSAGLGGLAEEAADKLRELGARGAPMMPDPVRRKVLLPAVIHPVCVALRKMRSDLVARPHNRGTPVFGIPPLR